MSGAYFGKTDVGSSQDLFGTQSQQSQNTANTSFTCPGSGLFDVTELSLCSSLTTTGGPTNVRLAVYNTSHVCLAQGKSEVALTIGQAWQGHIGQANISQSQALVGGVNYLLAYDLDGDGNSAKIWYATGISGDWKNDAVDYTGGFPTNWSPATASGTLKSIRCGVDQEYFIPYIPWMQMKPILAQ